MQRPETGKKVQAGFETLYNRNVAFKVTPMAPPFDESDFIDADYQNSKNPTGSGAMRSAGSVAQRPPSREELDGKVGETHQRLAELKRAQEQLERERVALEEARRRRSELHTGREEMLQHLTRGVGLLEEAEFNARRDSEQMSKSLVDLRDALEKVQAIREETWTSENWSAELTRALTTIENARMEWNGARLKWPLLNGAGVQSPNVEPKPGVAKTWAPESKSFLELCKLGLALTWPVALVGLLGIALLAYWLLR